MKAIIVRVTAMLALMVALAAVSAQAQTSLNTHKFTVPFEFNVGQEVLPAGDYTVLVENQTIRLRKSDGKANVIALSRRTINVSHRDSKIKLMFRQYGDQVYLSQVWLADGLGRELKRQKKESELLAQDSRIVEVQGQAR
jgi:hypothetical protein